MTNKNPLAGYFRKSKVFITLPSKDLENIYSDDVLTYTNDRKELGIMPMTSSDEMHLKNPDALLNGDAINKAIMSCVPDVKNPKKLLSNDVEVLMTAIRMVSLGNDLMVEAICPNKECNHKNSLAINLENALERITRLDSNYVVNLDSGVTVYVKPYTFELNLKVLTLGFEENKFFKSLESGDLSDLQRLRDMSVALTKVSRLNFDLIADSVISVVDDSNAVNVVNRDYIKDFLLNIPVENVHAIEKEITKINQIGMAKDFEAECTKCQNKWSAEFNFDMTRFFTTT
jgi:hypothetical protein